MQTINKEIMIMGAGAGVGVIIPSILRKYYPGQIIPHLEMLQNWGTYDTFIPLVSGAALFLFANFTNFIRNASLKNFITFYGVTAVAKGLLNGIFPVEVPGGRASSPPRLQTSSGVTRSRFGNGMTAVYQPSTSVRAKGFGSDITRPPTAATLTKITPDVVYS